MDNSIKTLTRQEYYTSQGFSGSTIDRPDDPVDEQFIRHCEQLKVVCNDFVEYGKTGNSKEAFTTKIENEDVSININENISIAVQSIDTILTTVRELVNLYTELYNVHNSSKKQEQKLPNGTEFAKRALPIIDSYCNTVQSLVSEQRQLQNKLQSIKDGVLEAKQQHNYVEIITSLEEILNIKL